MKAIEFFSSKSVVNVQWWLYDCDLPLLRWARLRVLSDGSVDVTWEEGGIRYGFSSKEYASYFLLEDEYVCFDKMDKEDEVEYRITLSGILPPSWQDFPSQPFEYLGTY